MTTTTPRRITAQSGPARLDQYLAGLDLGLTRSRLQQLIADGDVLVNGAAVKPSHRIRPGDRIQLSPPPPQPAAAIPQDIPLTVIYQDAHLIVIDKPPGLPAHPGPGHPDGTLVNGLLALCPDLQGIGGRIRPGIVHRLDKDTSGLIIAAKTETAHHHLSQQIKNRAIKKGYLALVQGAPSPPSGIIDVPIARDPRRRTRMAVTPNGRPSRTEYRTLQHITPHPSKRPTPTPETHNPPPPTSPKHPHPGTHKRRPNPTGTPTAHRPHPPSPRTPSLARPPHNRRHPIRQTRPPPPPPIPPRPPPSLHPPPNPPTPTIQLPPTPRPTIRPTIAPHPNRKATVHHFTKPLSPRPLVPYFTTNPAG